MKEHSTDNDSKSCQTVEPKSDKYENRGTKRRCCHSCRYRVEPSIVLRSWIPENAEQLLVKRRGSRSSCTFHKFVEVDRAQEVPSSRMSAKTGWYARLKGGSAGAQVKLENTETCHLLLPAPLLNPREAQSVSSMHECLLLLV